jgi:hypothetical protein
MKALISCSIIGESSGVAARSKKALFYGINGGVIWRISVAAAAGVNGWRRRKYLMASSCANVSALSRNVAAKAYGAWLQTIMKNGVA